MFPVCFTFAQTVQLLTGAKPLISLCFKPKLLFPKIDQDIVEPNDYKQWEELVYALVKHYKDRGAGIRYWEIGNEADTGEDGGSLNDLPKDMRTRHVVLEAASAGIDENQRLRPEPFVYIKKGNQKITVEPEPGRCITGRWIEFAD